MVAVEVAVWVEVLMGVAESVGVLLGGGGLVGRLTLWVQPAQRPRAITMGNTKPPIILFLVVFIRVSRRLYVPF
jgi:hypothetical protein